jgi:carbonic anhydrase/acetyltransferase-like protein (isoleucine patch superfamily)
MHFILKIYKLFFIWRYPGYIKHIHQKYMLPMLVKRKGVQLGSNVIFMGIPIVSILPGSVIRIGNDAVLCSKSEKTALGVNHPIVLRTLREGACLEIGQRVRMSGTTICAAKSVIIGDNTCIGANVTIADTDFHSLAPAIRSSESDFDFATDSSVEIGANVFLGMGCYILKGVSIGEGAIVGAGSVVAKSVQAFAIVAGNPAKVLGAVPGHSLLDDRS